MTLREYAGHIIKLLQDGYGEFKVVHASDDEGNSFIPVVYSPHAGHFDESNRELIDADEDNPANAICIN